MRIASQKVQYLPAKGLHLESKVPKWKYGCSVTSLNVNTITSNFYCQNLHRYPILSNRITAKFANMIATNAPTALAIP
jgi:hypothetical protein